MRCALVGGTYVYNANNLLTSATQSGVTSTLVYDAENRLYSTAKSGVTTQFLYDGKDLIAEYDGSGNLLRRYVHGPGSDEPLVAYDASGNKSWLNADDLGSVISVTSASGTTINTYDAYGLPGSGNTGRFQYTGQTWLPEIGIYYYKARLYNPVIGRFMQTDPIGYGDGMNWYAYVGNDPINGRDPTGLQDADEIIHGIAGGFTRVQNEVARAQAAQTPIINPMSTGYANIPQTTSQSPVAVAGVAKKPCKCAGAIAEAALSMNNDKSWAAKTGVHGKVGLPTCNIFVGTAIDKAGIRAPRRHGGLFGFRSASDWSNPNSNMGDMFELDTSAHMGDIVANSSHVGIVTGENESTGANPLVGSRSTSWPWNRVNVHGQPTFWKCKCQ